MKTVSYQFIHEKWKHGQTLNKNIDHSKNYTDGILYMEQYFKNENLPRSQVHENIGSNFNVYFRFTIFV
jgi:hypothetical protein